MADYLIQNTPLYVHDCDACEYLGSTLGHDFYSCSNTLIARWSSDGHDYISGTAFIGVDVRMNIAQSLKLNKEITR